MLQKRRTSLHEAVENGFTDAVEKLLIGGIYVPQIDKVIIACHRDSSETGPTLPPSLVTHRKPQGVPPDFSLCVW